MSSDGVIEMIQGLAGYGFPLHRGGPMCYADQQGQ